MEARHALEALEDSAYVDFSSTKEFRPNDQTHHGAGGVPHLRSLFLASTFCLVSRLAFAPALCLKRVHPTLRAGVYLPRHSLGEPGRFHMDGT